jgi:hypothetical protein
MSNLTQDELLFLEKMEQQRIKHNQNQKRYRENNADHVKEYNKRYYETKREKLYSIKKKIRRAPINVNVEEIIAVPVIDRRTRRGKKQTMTTEIKPRYETRTEPLEYSTIDDYITKANIINKLFNKRNLPAEVKAELRKLLNDNHNINEDLILNEMNYINDNIGDTIDKLRTHYKNDNSFKAYTNILTVIASHLKTINRSIHQALTKTGIYINKKVQEQREDNDLDEVDYNKIIDLDQPTIIKNISKLRRADDILLYALYTLQPARRLDYRNVKITKETNLKKLEDPSTNYLMISTEPYQFVFNDYKTYKKYKQQVIPVEDKTLNIIIDHYINEKRLKNGDYLFSLLRDKRETIEGPVFSKKISDVFKKVYGIPISARYLRMSWATHFYKTNPTAKEIKEFSEKMAHSPEESMLYKKIIPE